MQLFGPATFAKLQGWGREWGWQQPASFSTLLNRGVIQSQDGLGFGLWGEEAHN